MVSVWSLGETQVGSSELRTFDGKPLTREQPLRTDLDHPVLSRAPQMKSVLCI